MLHFTYRNKFIAATWKLEIEMNSEIETLKMEAHELLALIETEILLGTVRLRSRIDDLPEPYRTASRELHELNVAELKSKAANIRVNITTLGMLK
jgi:hypothetical protein